MRLYSQKLTNASPTKQTHGRRYDCTYTSICMHVVDNVRVQQNRLKGKAHLERHAPMSMPPVCTILFPATILSNPVFTATKYEQHRLIPCPSADPYHTYHTLHKSGVLRSISEIITIHWHCQSSLTL
jgi:hypothetical protein